MTSPLESSLLNTPFTFVFVGGEGDAVPQIPARTRALSFGSLPNLAPEAPPPTPAADGPAAPLSLENCESSSSNSSTSPSELFTSVDNSSLETAPSPPSLASTQTSASESEANDADGGASGTTTPQSRKGKRDAAHSDDDNELENSRTRGPSLCEGPETDDPETLGQESDPAPGSRVPRTTLRLVRPRKGEVAPPQTPTPSPSPSPLSTPSSGSREGPSYFLAPPRTPACAFLRTATPESPTPLARNGAMFWPTTPHQRSLGPSPASPYYGPVSPWVSMTPSPQIPGDGGAVMESVEGGMPASYPYNGPVSPQFSLSPSPSAQAQGGVEMEMEEPFLRRDHGFSPRFSPSVWRSRYPEKDGWAWGEVAEA
ncbi:MAG: hypothetical protein M1829_005517 [Trizodia sp. TS-e1964]|nr:MAG: hypothetical protein M1829_005517 [Trizodia sp. TS-e1964]